MSKLACAIIEDDPVSMAMIEGLAEKTNLLDIKGSFNAAEPALQWLATNKTDLLFLDIELPEISGLQLLRALVYRPAIIIISSNPQYAVDAFEFDVADYLVKPIKDYARFLAAVHKALTKTKENSSQPEKPVDSSLFVRIDSVLLKLSIDDILWVEAFGDYIKIHTREKEYTVYSTLKKIEEKISSTKFVRVHRSYIVNVTKVTNIDPYNLEINKKIIPISATYKETLLSRISVL